MGLAILCPQYQAPSNDGLELRETLSLIGFADGESDGNHDVGPGQTQCRQKALEPTT